MRAVPYCAVCPDSAARLFCSSSSYGTGVGTAGAATTASASANSSGVLIVWPSRPGRWNMAWLMIESMLAGTPADTCRGVQTDPSMTGAGGRPVSCGPGQ